MSNHDHVNTDSGKVSRPAPGFWYSCRQVSLTGDHLISIVDGDGLYDLVGAYRRAPHLAFLRVGSDKDLVRFVRRWGPLWWDWELTSAADYWRSRRRLRALLGLAESFHQKERWSSEEALRGLITEFVEADRERTTLLLPAAAEGETEFYPWGVRTVISERRYEEELEWQERVSCAPLGELRRMLCKCIDGAISIRQSLRVAPGGRRRVGVAWDLRNLEEALLWMVLNDFWRRRPVRTCAECGKYFGPRTAREREFCSYRCGHRKAAREWRRRNSRRLRKEPRR